MTERKTTRKNKTNLVMTWPSNDQYFTIESLSQLNPDFVNITLRVRLKKAIETDGLVEEIGYKNHGKGRPTKAFAMKPASKEAIEKAIADGITIEAPASPVTVVQINPDKTQDTTPMPVTKILGSTVTA